MRLYKNLFLCTSAIAILAGCGSSSGGSSSSSSSTQKQTISGSVIDPEVEGATVTLECSDRTYSASGKTGSDGKYSIELDSSVDVSNCTLVSTGGKDGGLDFKGLSLKAPYSLYNSNSSIYITPFTNMVANHNDFSSNPQNALSEVASFLGITSADLVKNPTSNMSLLKISNKLGTIAVAKDSNGNQVGFLDLDSDNITQSSFTGFINNELSTKVSSESYSILEKSFKLIDISNNVNDIKYASINPNVFNTIKNAYNFTDDTYDDKITYLSNKIIDSAKDDSGNYSAISTYQIKKAFYDVALVPAFETSSDTNTTVLSTTVKNIFDYTQTNFQTYIDSKTINIKDINGLIVVNSNTTKQVLGNNNDLRRGYYTYSDKSNIAKALNLAEGSFSDNVNDPINNQVAVALAKLGYYKEAIEQIQDNVYTPDNTQDGFTELGETLYGLGQNSYSAQAFTGQYNSLNAQIESLGKENVSSSNLDKLQEIIRDQIKTKYYANTSDGTAIKGSTTMAAYLESLASFISSKSYYKIPDAFEDVAIGAYFNSNNLTKAQEYINKSISLISKTPNDATTSTAVYYSMRQAIIAQLFGQDGSAAVARAKALNDAYTSKDYLDYASGTYGYYDLVYNAIAKNITIDTAIANLATVKSSYRDDALKYGLATALFLNGKENELFSTYYGTNDYFSSSNKDTLMQYATMLISGNMPSATQGIKLLGTDAQLEDFLDRLDTLANTWTGISDSDAQKIYAQWGTADNAKYGYLAMASHYKDLNKTSKAENMISTAISKVSALSTSNEKLEGLTFILKAMSDLNLGDNNKTKVLTELMNAANSDSMNSTNYIDDIIGAANILSANNMQTQAKTLVDKAYGLVPSATDGDLTSIQDFSEYLIGKYNSSKDFEHSISNGYAQAGQATLAQNILNEANAKINTLANTTNKYTLKVNVAKAYAGLNKYSNIAAILSEIKTVEQNELAKTETAKSLANYDAFVATTVASIDSDRDGKPDFWDLNAKQSDITASGLELDDDIDGDNILDTTDELPYNNVSL